jgi:hypothetical protein
MTITALTPATPAVQVDGDRIVVRDLTVAHAEAAALVRRRLQEDGLESVAELLRRAIPVGLVALSMGSAAVDTGAITRTLDAFADRVDTKSQLAMTRLEETLTQLQAGEQAVADAARHVLGQLPSQVETVLAGEAATVRAAVVDAARSVQTSGLQQLSAALAEHSQSVRNALSLDREGPVRMLRQELVTEIHGTRRELAEQLTALRGMGRSGPSPQGCVGEEQPSDRPGLGNPGYVRGGGCRDRGRRSLGIHGSRARRGHNAA